MEYLMIHDIRKEYFDLALDRYRLTFDDGLFTQYYYYPLFKSHPQALIYFITTNFIKPGQARGMFSGEYMAYLKSKKYGYRTFVEGRFDHFMTVEELQELSGRPNVRIGAHSHFHDVILTRTHPRKRKPLSEWKRERFGNRPEILSEDFSIRSRLAFQGFFFKDAVLTRRSEAQWEAEIKSDTEQCLQWMHENLGLTPEIYCFPFNEYSPKLLSILKTFGFKRFFASRPIKNQDIVGRLDIDSLVDV